MKNPFAMGDSKLNLPRQQKARHKGTKNEKEQ